MGTARACIAVPVFCRHGMVAIVSVMRWWWRQMWSIVLWICWIGCGIGCGIWKQYGTLHPMREGCTITFLSGWVVQCELEAIWWLDEVCASMTL